MLAARQSALAAVVLLTTAACGRYGLGSVEPAVQAVETIGELQCSVGEILTYDGADWICGVPSSDTLGDLSCAAGESPRFDGATWACVTVPALNESLAGVATCANGGVLARAGDAWGCIPLANLSGTLASIPCSASETLIHDGVGWTCAAISTTTDTLAALPCSDGQVASSNGGNWVCTFPIAPTGADFALSLQSCGAGEVVDGVDALGNLTCATHVGISQSCSSGNVVTGVDATGQLTCRGAARSSQGCIVGSFATGVDATGQLTCEVGVLGSQICPPTQRASGIDVTGKITCDDVGTVTDVTAGAGLTRTGTANSPSLSVDFAGTGTAVTAARSDHDHWANLIDVDATGTASQNGSALRAALAALNPSATNPYTIRLSPGSFDVGGTALAMRAFVDIAGAGEMRTSITGTGLHTVEGADDAEIRFLTVESESGTAFYCFRTTPRLVHVRLLASGGNRAIGLDLDTFPSNPYLHDVTIIARDGSIETVGLANAAGKPIVRGLRIYVTGSSPDNSGIQSGAGIHEYRDVEIIVDATGGINHGLYNLYSTVTLNDVSIRVSGGVTNYGVDTLGDSLPATTTLDRSTVEATDASLNCVGAMCQNRAGATKLDGGAPIGNATCVGAYDETYAPLSASCL